MNNPYYNNSYAAEKAWDNILEAMYDREEDCHEDDEPDEPEEEGEEE